MRTGTTSAAGPKGPAAATPRRADVYVAIEAFSAVVDGEPVVIQVGDRVRAGHSLLRDQGGYFEPVADHVQYDVEQASAAPGELRQR